MVEAGASLLARTGAGSIEATNSDEWVDLTLDLLKGDFHRVPFFQLWSLPPKEQRFVGALELHEPSTGDLAEDSGWASAGDVHAVMLFPDFDDGGYEASAHGVTPVRSW